MKKWLYSIPVVFLMIVLAMCSSPMTSISSTDPGSEIALPRDIISDTGRTFEGDFSFETLLPVYLNITVELYENDAGADTGAIQLEPTAGRIFLSLTDKKGNKVYEGLINNKGEHRGVVYLPAAAEDIVLRLTAEGFEDREVIIENMVNYEKIDRVMAMGKLGSVISSKGLEPDSDGDGVPDAYDINPYNSSEAFEVGIPANGNLTIAFEDLYGREDAGDADYNDFIAEYSITETLDGEARLKKVEITVTAKEKIAGYDHVFGIRFNSFQGTASVEGNYIDAGGTTQSFSMSEVESPLNIELFKSTSKAKGKNAQFTITFTEVQNIDETSGDVTVDRPPYNPYLYVKNTGFDVHLIGEESLDGAYNSFMDENNFPWALLVPASWEHPLETQRIEVPYPRFTRWRESGGELSPDWYLHDTPYPEEDVSGVYTAGYYEDPTAGVDVAAYWKDNEINILSSASKNARANDLFVYNGDVFVVGYEGIKGNEKACLWKNGSKIEEFSAGDETRGEARAIWVDSTGVYIAGFYGYGSNESIWYWDGSSLKYLVENKSYGDTTGIQVWNSQVYVSGYYSSSEYSYVASYWVDGAEAVSGGVYDGLSRGLGLDLGPGGEVFISGLFYYNSNYSSAYWSSFSGLTPLYTSSMSFAYGVDEVNGDIYSAGYYGSGIGTAAYWWDDGSTVTRVDLGDGRALDITIVTDTVYSAGYSYDGQKKIGGYWTGSDFTMLYNSESSGVDAEINAIQVVE